MESQEAYEERIAREQYKGPEFKTRADAYWYGVNKALTWDKK